jgi:CRP/FNR family transcriptional regulator, cyclic AMP receptor protein
MSAGPAGPDATLVGVLNRDWDRPSTSDWAAVLAHLPLFAHVRKRHLRRIADLAEIREFQPGDVVIQKGDVGDGFYLILGGHASVVEPKQARRLKTGDYFGEMALLDGEPRSATVVAVGELQTMRLPRRPFIRLLEQEPSISIAMLTELGNRIRRLEKSAVA